MPWMARLKETQVLPFTESSFDNFIAWDDRYPLHITAFNDTIEEG